MCRSYPAALCPKPRGIPVAQRLLLYTYINPLNTKIASGLTDSWLQKLWMHTIVQCLKSCFWPTWLGHVTWQVAFSSLFFPPVWTENGFVLKTETWGYIKLINCSLVFLLSLCLTVIHHNNSVHRGEICTQSYSS
jgi:hypothetical protein